MLSLAPIQPQTSKVGQSIRPLNINLSAAKQIGSKAHRKETYKHVEYFEMFSLLQLSKSHNKLFTVVFCALIELNIPSMSQYLERHIMNCNLLEKRPFLNDIIKYFSINSKNLHSNIPHQCQHEQMHQYVKILLIVECLQ